MAQYSRYLPLSQEHPESEFRLLTIKSRDYVSRLGVSTKLNNAQNTYDSQIHCELNNVLRQPIPNYTAISYTWGEEEPTATILVDGSLLMIRPNLDSLLQTLQDPLNDIVLWIDAICVNQDDDDEKSRQVPLMTSIYEEAVNTVAWLGPADEESNGFLVWFNALGQSLEGIDIIGAVEEMARLSSHENIELYQQASNRVKALCEEPLRAHEEMALERMLGFRNMLKRPYWTRLWVLQEFIVSKNIEIRCGTQRVEFDRLRTCTMFLNLLPQHMHGKVVQAFHSGGENATLHGEPVAGRWINEFMKPLPSRPGVLIGRRVSYHGQGQSRSAEANKRQSLIQLLAGAHVLRLDGQRCCSQEDKDKIYGILSFAADAAALKAAGLVVNYGKDASVVFTEAARAMILCGHLDVLSYCQHSTPGLPSWVPDWREEIRRPCGDHAWDTAFAASANASFTPLPQSGENELQVRGLKVDTIESFKEAWDPGLQAINLLENYHKVRAFLGNIQALCHESDLKCQKVSCKGMPDIYVNSSDRIEAYYRIPIADQESTDFGLSRRASATTSLEGYNLLRANLICIETSGVSIDVKIILYLNMMGYLSRRPFISQKGFVGLGPTSLKCGDVIVILEGAKLPYVLREERNSQKTTWKLVGEAYVHGIMYGEFKKHDQEMETFCLL